MNVNKLYGAAQCVEYSGNFLSKEKSIILQNSLTILQAENHFRNVYLWGILLGQEADYYISYGYEKDPLFGRKFFYSLTGEDWGLVPTHTADDHRMTQLCSQLFQGDPGLVTEVMDGAPLQNQETRKDISTTIQQSVTQLKEENRLSATIVQINQDSAIVPRGALWKDLKGNVRINAAFEGLDADEAWKHTSYMHYRKPANQWNTNLLNRIDYNYNLDFLDTIDKDVPQGCWRTQLELGGRLAITRSLYWPGMTAYHWVNTPDWSFLYIGNGRKNWDVPNMIYA